MSIRRKQGEAALTRRTQRRAARKHTSRRPYRFSKYWQNQADRDSAARHRRMLKGLVGRVEHDRDYEQIEAAKYAMPWVRRRRRRKAQLEREAA